MQFTVATAIAILGATTVSAQVIREQVAISELSLWKSDADSMIQSLSFKLTGGSGNLGPFDCSVDSPGSLPTALIECAVDASYKFSVQSEDGSLVNVLIEHQTSDFDGTTVKGMGGVAAYCHAGGNGRTICTQTEPIPMSFELQG